MTTLRIDHAYHGARFAGWAAQPGKRTVEAELTEALRTVLGGDPRLRVAGRTDAGVHAWGQVASLSIGGEPDPDLRRSLNGLTGHDLVVLGAEPAADEFDARGDARSRTYCYRVLAGPVPSPFESDLSLWWPYPLELEPLERAAAALRGRHDFTAFTPTDTIHTRFERDIARAEWVAEPAEPGDPRRRLGLAQMPVPPRGRAGASQMLAFWIEADAFMRSMVRILIGTMLEVGSGRRSIEDFERLLEGAPRDQAGATAQPHGLHLASVSY